MVFMATGYGKVYSSLWDGSMMGAGAVRFAVWTYCLSQMKPVAKPDYDGRGRPPIDHFSVELNPKLLAFKIGETEEDILDAINFLCSPDPNSRTEIADGRRIIRKGSFDYQVVNGKKYHELGQKEKHRQAQARYQQRKLEEEEEEEPEQQEESETTESSSSSTNGTPEASPKKETKKETKKASDYSLEARNVLGYLNTVARRNFQFNKANLSMIQARLDEDKDVNELGMRMMIKRKCDQWLNDPKMSDYLRPDTLFRPKNFPGYYASRNMPVENNNHTPQGKKFHDGANVYETGLTASEFQELRSTEPAKYLELVEEMKKKIPGWDPKNYILQD